jgi:hypothetical protein
LVATSFALLRAAAKRDEAAFAEARAALAAELAAEPTRSIELVAAICEASARVAGGGASGRSRVG